MKCKKGARYQKKVGVNRNVMENMVGVNRKWRALSKKGVIELDRDVEP